MLVQPAGGFVLQHHTKWCSSDSVLATAKECESAKAALDPSAAAIQSEEVDDAPKGCSRFEGQWFFNTHAKGKLDGASEPVCKADAGKASTTLNTMSRTYSVCFWIFRMCLWCMHACLQQLPPLHNQPRRSLPCHRRKQTVRTWHDHMRPKLANS